MRREAAGRGVIRMKRFVIMGCGFLGGIVADAYAKGLLPDYELVGVASRTMASALALAERPGCRAAEDIDGLLAMKPDLVVETASVE